MFNAMLNELYEVTTHPRDSGRATAAFLEQLLDGAPLVCNSLDLEFGTQQPNHTDRL
jgi:hypothetical protein